MAAFDETLYRFMKGGSHALSKVTGIPKTTIDSWLQGRVKHPRDWRPILTIAQALLLTREDADTLLLAAGHSSIHELSEQLTAEHPDRRYLQPWIGTAPPSPSARHQLRAPVGDFVGRTSEIDQLVQALRRTANQSTLAAITGVQGMGGIGKTELAHVVAYAVRSTFSDAQIRLDLRGSNPTPVTPEQALQTVIRAFIPDAKLPDDLHTLKTLYCTRLHNKRVLILADDAHNAAQVEPLLPPAGCALLVTSRTRFTLPAMITIDLDQLSAAEAIQLLRTICPRLTEDEAATLAQTCGYLPLALRVSGSILHNDSILGVVDYLTHLSDERQRLIHLCDPDDPQRDVEAALMVSYFQLNATAQLVFRQLGVIVADFTTNLALAVVTAPLIVDITAILRLLRRRNLLLYAATHDRWRLHDLVRDVARRLLETTGETEIVMWRYARAIVQIAQASQEQYLTGGENMHAALNRFDMEQLHIDASRHWIMAQAGTSHADQLLLDLAVATNSIGELRYNAQRERIPLWKHALAAARRLGNRNAEALTLKNLGNAYFLLGDIPHASEVQKLSLAIAREIGDRHSESLALGSLGNIYTVQGDIRRAIPYYEQSLMIAHQLNDQRSEGIGLGNLGNAYRALGDIQRAISYYEQNIAIAREIGNRQSEAVALGNLGNAYLQQGEVERAIHSFEQRLNLARELGDRCGEGITLCNLGNAYLQQENAQRAVESCANALTILRVIGDQRTQGYALTYLARAQVLQGNTTDATNTFEQALSILHAIPDRSGEAECCWHYGLFLTQQGDREHALTLLRTAVAYEKEVEHTKATEHAALLARVEAGETLPTEFFPRNVQRTVGDVKPRSDPRKGLDRSDD